MYENFTFSTFAGAAGTAGSTDGTGSAARFSSPSGVAIDSAGNVYVADTFNNTIRKITHGAAVSTFVGTPGVTGGMDGTGAAAQFNAPIGVAVDSSDNVYVADSGNNTVRKITPGGVVTTLAGLAGSAGSMDGTGSGARFNGPRAVAVDSAFNVYVADTFNHTIRKITPGGVVTTLAGLASNPGSANGTGSAARFRDPKGIAVDNAGNIYVGDTFNDIIRKITPGGVVTTLAGVAGNVGSSDGSAAAARFSAPTALTVDRSGNLFVDDTNNQTIRRVRPNGFVTTVGGSPGLVGSTDGSGAAARFNAPQGIIVSPDGRLFVGDTGNDTVRLGVPPSAYDFNQDGHPDFVLDNAVPHQTAVWYLNNNVFSSGLFGPTVPAGWSVAGVADFNGDGHPDYLLFNSSTRQTAIWYLNNNVFSSGLFGPTVPAGWSVAGVADFNGDGHPDYLLFNSSTRQTAIWYLNNNVFSSGLYGPTLPVDLSLIHI